MYLISYRADESGRIIYGYDIVEDPVVWVDEVQQYPGTYILLNAQPITKEQADKYDGVFKGM